MHHSATPCSLSACQPHKRAAGRSHLIAKAVTNLAHFFKGVVHFMCCSPNSQTLSAVSKARSKVQCKCNTVLVRTACAGREGTDLVRWIILYTDFAIIFAINLVGTQQNIFKKMKGRKILQDSLGHWGVPTAGSTYLWTPRKNKQCWKKSCSYHISSGNKG